ncbi:rhodanese-like domain-containing protein [Draconibacterium halophilum]|uniref:Rhodanese-like domain-containing protein n=1 Tax=Draconibacterium halophilum TaxID=2706887 RepID=A0A6C0RBA1_9BACT|nr:rhodanese-like domain-containing protein [Draconibacterium halophilum]QIA06753.1 rhodanese-like domain-containing protein [Draconibacterium halophilum]
MNARIKISILLAGVGLILAFLPFNAAKSFQLKPTELVELSANTDMYFSVDEVARFVNIEDSTIQLIDLRSPAEFMKSNIPGSINIPYNDLLNPNWEGYLNQDKVRNVYYSNGDETANMAWTIVSGLGYSNSFVMEGGMNEWYKTVMLSKFEGERITPRENALFENRYKARKTFIHINSLPDSLKTQYLEAKRLEESQLDGGC